MRTLLLLGFLGGLPLAVSLAQSPSPSAPSISVTPTAGGLSTVHQALAQGLPAAVPALIALFDPSGGQTVTLARTDGQGAVSQTLKPSGGQWKVGLYRWVVALAGGKSISATFVASDGSPHLYAEPYQPSPTSALNFVATGFPVKSSIELRLLLTGAGGERILHAQTDADGTFSIFVWPQQLGFNFFAAGDYKISAPVTQLTTDFRIREQPASSTVSVDSPVRPGGMATMHFVDYLPQHYIWGVYADLDGHLEGEFLVGPTNLAGGLETLIVLPNVPPGLYLLATPYDWGETSFTIAAPPPTATPTVTPTSAITPTATAPSTSTPRPTIRVCRPKRDTRPHRPRHCQNR